MSEKKVHRKEFPDGQVEYDEQAGQIRITRNGKAPKTMPASEVGAKLKPGNVMPCSDPDM